MSRTGSTIRSAKMKAITPPNLMPPFHSTAASGTSPIEHTNEITDTSGPTRGPQIAETSGSRLKKNACHHSRGSQAPSAPVHAERRQTLGQAGGRARVRVLQVGDQSPQPGL